MIKNLRSGPTTREDGFEFPPYDMLRGGLVTDAIDVLASAMAVRNSASGADAAALNAVLVNDHVRLSATASQSHAESRRKKVFLEAGIANLGAAVGAQAKAIMDASMAYEEGLFAGQYDHLICDAETIPASTKARLAELSHMPLPRDRIKAVSSSTSVARWRRDRHSGSVDVAPRLSVQPSDVLRLSLAQRVRLAKAMDRQIEALFHQGDLGDAQVVAHLVNDLALTIAASEPRSRWEAVRSVSYLLLHLAHFGYTTNATVMLRAAIDMICCGFGIEMGGQAPS